jgi:23S rRNA G2445 N2-methylase RlmL
MNKRKIVLPCPPHIAPVVREEVEALGYKVQHEGPLEVSLEGSLHDCMKLNLHLRSANKVLWQLGSFKAKTPDQLYKHINDIVWEQYFFERGYLCVTSYVKNDSIQNTQFANVKVKDAIVDRLMDINGVRPDSGPLRDQMVVFLHWSGDDASIYIDTSGETIAKHGYRKVPFKAPMMESLASATILTSTWDTNQLFINPMCGSGTLAIEAACIAANKAPGLNRDSFGFMFLKQYDKKEWEALKEEARKQEKAPTQKIIATDISRLALQAAQKNAEIAGVSEFITFKKCDFRDTPVPEGDGVVFLNPEYGERLGEEKELEIVYKQIGDFFKQSCKGKTGYIFTGNLKLAKSIGLRTKRRMPFMNAKIECRLLEYELYRGSKKPNK